MQILIYVWRNVHRNKLRTSLTVLSICFSLALMTLLYGYMAMQGEWGEDAEKHHRIVIMNSQGFSGMLPIAYVDRIRSMPGVKAAVPYAWFGGHYKEEQYPFAQFGTDAKFVFKVWEEFSIDPQQLSEWQKTRNGCVVDRRIAEKRRWKTGERIPLKGTYYPVTLDLVLCGVFDSPKNTDTLWFHWEYCDELMKKINAPGSGNSGTIFAKTERGDLMPTVSQAIDDKFASSENPTRTQTEAAFAQMFTDMLGNVQAYILIISVIVTVSLTLVAGSAMAMAILERTTEIAVLKAIGFSRTRVLATVLAEACLVTVMGGLLGITMGCGVLQLLHLVMPQMFPFAVYEMFGPWIVYLVAISAGIGLTSGIYPAIRGAQLSVIDGLRRVV